MRAAPLALLAAFLLGACKDEPSGPQQGYTIRVQSGDDQLGGYGQLLEDPLQVVVEDAITDDPAPGIVVRWSIESGSGAVLGALTSTTSPSGIASTSLRLGPTDSVYRVHATVDERVGDQAAFDAFAVTAARIDSIAPARVTAGATIALHGTAFSAAPQSNTVLVAGMRAVVLEATTTVLRAVVPPCVPTRSADVRVLKGNVESNARTIDVTATADAPVSLDVGEVLLLPDASPASCLRLPAIADSRYLLVLHNGAALAGRDLALRFAGAVPQSLVATPGIDAERLPAPRLAAARESASRQADLDAELRDFEQLAVAARPAGAPRLSPPPVAARTVEVGDQRQFWVFRSTGSYARITAEVRHVSAHAILYEDLDAPAGGYTSAEFAQFGAAFDDPIYESMVDVYGQPSDVDGNGKVIILFTPVVNRLTPPGSPSSFVAGFFFGIDLLDGQANGNDAEIFYTLVPDPAGEFGNVRTSAQLIEGVPPVMAHEFQHMIHFNQRVLLRDAGLEATWLSEALAHAAEELVGDVYLGRGDDERSVDFRIQNFLRAAAYMESPGEVSPLGPAVPLPVRGAGWLLLEYLQGHFGGNALLTALTQTSRNSVDNVTAQVPLPWTEILSRWGTAMWADDNGVPGLDPVYSYPTVDLRAVYASMGFPLQPTIQPFADFAFARTLPAAAASFWSIEAGAAPVSLNVTVAGRNAPFGTSDRPLLTVLRIQ